MVRGDAYVLEDDLAMTVAGVVSEDRQRPQDLDAGGIHRDQNEAVLHVLLALRVAQPEEEADLAAWVGGSAGPPFTAVDHVLVAVLGAAGFDGSRVGAGDAVLGHHEARHDLAIDATLKPLFPLLLGAVVGHYLHLAG